MRIVYYNALLNEPWGCGVHGRALVQSWRRSGHRVLCLPEDLAEGTARPQLSRTGRWRWIPDILRMPALDLRARLRVLASSTAMASKIRAFRPDVLVARRAAYDYVLDRLARERGDLKLVAEVNALLYWELRNMNNEVLPAWEEGRERRFLCDADAAVAVSDAIAAQLVQCGLDSQRVFVVPNGTDVGEFRPGTTADPDVESWSNSMEKVVAYCGTFAANHDMDTLAGALRILAEHASIGFLFVGPTPEEMARALGVESLDGGRVMCTGRVPHERVPGLLACADVCWAALSNDRGSALKLFEYMAMGLPVAWADEQQGSRIVEEAECGLCAPRGDAERLADAVLRVLGDDEEALRMGARGRSWVEEHADWGGVAARMLGCLSEVEVCCSRETKGESVVRRDSSSEA